MKFNDSPFLILLRAGLWNICPEAGETEVFREADWPSLFDQAKAHAVLALVADGMNLLPEELFPSDDFRIAFAKFTDLTEGANKKVNNVLDVMSTFWKQSEVTALVLKGQGLANMYPNPLHRTPGDIDWYFPGKVNFEKANELARGKGAILKIDGDSDYHYTVGGVVVEHHSNWCDISAPLRQKRVEELEKRFGYDNSGAYTMLSPELTLLQLNAHILKHALVKGIGWRQLCDLAQAYKNLCGRYDSKQFCDAANSLGLLKWSKLLAGVLERYLGLNSEYLPFAANSGKDVDILANLVNRSGNFGAKNRKGMFLSWLSSASLFSRYAFRELIWRPVTLAQNRTKQKLKKNR